MLYFRPPFSPTKRAQSTFRSGSQACDKTGWLAHDTHDYDGLTTDPDAGH